MMPRTDTVHRTAPLKPAPRHAEANRMIRRAPIALVVVLLALSGGASAAAAPAITEYSGGLSEEAAPRGIVAGPEGNLWFTQSAGTFAIDRVTPGGVITSYPTKGSSAPLDITQGPDGKLWYTASGPGTKFGTIDTLNGAVTEYSGAPALTAVGITAGPEGDLWIAESGLKAEIGRFAPSTLKLTEFEVPTKASEPTGITVGPEEDIWFTENSKPGAIGRFNPTTKEFHEYTKGLTVNDEPAGITAGPDGNIWFTEATSPGKIGRIDPGTGTIEEFSTGLTLGKPEQIVTGSDGNLYFTEANGSGALGRITPAGEITEFKTGLSVSLEPWGIAAGPDGNIWFTESAKPAKVGKLPLTPEPPAVTVGPASQITASGATLNGEVNPHGVPTAFHFEWGATSAYGSYLPLPDASAGAGTSPVSVSAALNGLQPGTTYHYRLVASNCGGCASGTIAGPDTTFTTPEKLTAGLGPYSPVAGSGESPAVAPVVGQLAVPPVVGRLAGIEPESGTILVERPSSDAFAALRGSQTVPTGSVIDASHGVLRLVTALDGHGRTQTATVWGGVFEVRQSAAGGGLTRLILKGALPSCGGAKRARASSRRPAVKPRRLWAKDNHGRYRSEGAYSATTVLGTEWETEDTCAGTITRVVKGRVRVRGLRTHRSILVRAGHSYLVRP